MLPFLSLSLSVSLCISSYTIPTPSPGNLLPLSPRMGKKGMEAKDCFGPFLLFLWGIESLVAEAWSPNRPLT